MNYDDTPGSNPSIGRLSNAKHYPLPLRLMCVPFPPRKLFHSSHYLLTLLTLASHLQSKKANFDASHELEELLLEDNPLKAKQRKARDVNSLSAEMRQMEEQYGARSLSLYSSQRPLFLDSPLTTFRRCSAGHIIHKISR